MRTAHDFQRELDLIINEARSRGTLSSVSGWLTTIETALGSDTTTHDRTIQRPPTALDQTFGARPGQPQAFFNLNVMRLINSCKADGFSAAAMASAIGATITAVNAEVNPHDISIVAPLSTLLVPGKQHS
jgi:hypothetical protein